MIETLNSLGITNGMITSAGITIVISLIAVIGRKAHRNCTKLEASGCA